MKFLSISHKLKSYYFSRGVGGAEPVRSIDVSNDELATALDCSKNQAEKVLKYACCEYARIYKRGNPYRIYAEGNVTIDGAVVFLLFACKVAQRAGEKKSKNFQECLKDSFDFDEGGNPPYCLNAMWATLVIWCKKNDDYRELVLPEEVASRKHIGKTQDITFPTWRDEHSLRALVSLRKNSSLKQIERDLISTSFLPSSATPAFCDFFEQYRELLKKEEPARHETLFGKFLRKFFKLSHPNLLTENSDPFDLVLSITSFNEKRELTYADHKWSNIAHGFSCLAKKLPHQSLLKKHLSKFFILFEKTGYGEFTATVQPECNSIFIAFREEIKGRFSQFGFYDLGGGWFFSKEIEFDSQIKSLLNQYSGIKESFFELEGGVRHRTSILRYSSFLPKVRALCDGKMKVGVKEYINCKVGQSYSIGKELKCGELPICFYGKRSSRLRMLKVYDSAPIIPVTKFSNWSWVTHNECSSNRYRDIEVGKYVQPRRKPCKSMIGLQEALYFKGRSGIGTKELIELVSMVVPKKGPNVWDVIRSCVEGGWLVPYWARRYGVVKYQVVRPHFVKLGERIVLWGARAKSIVECFIKRVEARGGHVSARNGLGSYSPKFWEATGVSIEDLEATCTEPQVWGETIDKPIYPEIAQKKALFESLRIDGADRYFPTFYWDWEQQCFTTQYHNRDVEIKILKHPECNDGESKHHTLYEVVVSGSSLLVTPVRNMAMLAGYRAAGEMIFSYDSQLLRRLGREGYLPLPFATAGVFAFKCCGGPVLSGDEWQYAYAMNDGVSSYVGKQLGDTLFAGLPKNDFIRGNYEYPSGVLRYHRPEVRNRYRG